MIGFYVFMAAGGLFYIVAAINKWTWIRNLEQRMYFPRRASWHTARRLYLIVGIGGLASAIAGIFRVLLSSNSVFVVVIGFGIGLSASLFFANTLSNYRHGKSIIEWFKNDEE